MHSDELLQLDARQLQNNNGTGDFSFRDGGKRVFTYGEQERLAQNVSSIHHSLSRINAIRTEQSILNEQRDILLQSLTESSTRYQEQINDLDEELQVKEQEKQRIVAQCRHRDTGGEEPKAENHSAASRKEKRAATKKILKFILVMFIAEVVTYLATIHFQKETLSLDVILWRFVFVLAIFVYTWILYAKYLKSPNRTMKGLLFGCILMSFFSTIHSIVVAALGMVSVEPDATISLNAVAQTVESRGGVLDFILYNPGLIEFVLATGIVFAGEAVSIDNKKKGEVSVAPTDVKQTQDDQWGKAELRQAERHLQEVETIIFTLSEKKKTILLDMKANVEKRESQLQVISGQIDAMNAEVEELTRKIDSECSIGADNANSYDRLLQKECTYCGIVTAQIPLVTKEDIYIYALDTYRQTYSN